MNTTKKEIKRWREEENKDYIVVMKHSQQQNTQTANERQCLIQGYCQGQPMEADIGF
jgi:hypothetical protein